MSCISLKIIFVVLITTMVICVGCSSSRLNSQSESLMGKWKIKESNFHAEDEGFDCTISFFEDRTYLIRYNDIVRGGSWKLVNPKKIYLKPKQDISKSEGENKDSRDFDFYKVRRSIQFTGNTNHVEITFNIHDYPNTYWWKFERVK